MYFIYLAAVLGCLWGNTSAGYSQFFYTGLPAPVQQSYYRAPIQQNYYRAPVQHAYQPFVPAPAFYNPIPQFYNPHAFAYHHTSPASLPQVQANNVQARNNEENDAIEVTPPPAQTAQPSAQADTFNFQQKESNAFRGFAYHTEYDNGARSNVVFLTGPEIHKLQSPIALKANTHTSASDAIDSIAARDDTAAAEPNPSIRALMQFFENPQMGVQKFYSVDNTIVARRLEDDFNSYPSNTLPLAPPLSPVYSVLRSSFSLGDGNAGTTQKPKDEPIGLASETRSNTVQPDVSTTSAPASTTTEKISTTEAISSTTEAISSTTEAVSTTAVTEATSSMAPIVVEDPAENSDSKEESS